MTLVSPEAADDIFSNTHARKVLVADDGPAAPFGILDFEPHSVTSPPHFTEEATLEAMHNLHVLPEDLVPRGRPEFGNGDLAKKMKFTIEMEKKRYSTIEKIITERNRILSHDKDLANLGPEKKGKQRRKKNINGKKKRKRPAPNKKVIPPRVPRLPAPKVQKKKPAKPSVRRAPRKPVPPPPRPQPVKPESVTWKPSDAALNRKKKEDAKREAAERALQRVKEAQKRQEQLKKQKEELVKQKAQQRLKRLKGEETMFERKKRQLKEASDAEMQRKERRYMRLQEKKRRKFEAEQRWRQQNIYGQHKEMSEQQSFSALRRKLLAAIDSPSGSVSSNTPVQATPTPAEPQKRILGSPKLLRPPHTIGIPQIRKPVPETQKSRTEVPKSMKALFKLPVVGNGRTRIPCLRT